MGWARTRRVVQYIGKMMMLLAESQKGVNVVQRCSFENQKGAVAIYFVVQR